MKRWSLKSVRTRWSVHEVTCVLVPEKGSKKGFIPLGWALTLFQVKNSHVMEWWRKDSEKRAFCSNYIYTFRSFPCIKNNIKIDKITIVVHELYYFTCNLYSNLFSLKYITQWFKKYRKYVVFSTFC